MDKRGKAYRLWTAYLKYVSRVNRNLYYWRVKDENAPRGYRDAKNWKELDADPELGNVFANMMGIDIECLPHTVKNGF